MDVGVALPTTVGGVWDEPDLLGSWAEAIDEGPFASLSIGTRVASDAPETVALAGAVAVWTRRLRIRCSVTPQLHSTTWLAKSMATLDRLSGGRVEVALGVGPRDEDYRALAIDVARMNVQEIGTIARRMRWLWQGQHLSDTVRPVGPSPVQPAGPSLLMSTGGAASARSAAGWADGVAHTILGPGEVEVAEVLDVFASARTAWAAEGRTAPRLAVAFWCALEETSPQGARAQVEDHLRDYVDWTPPAFLDDIVPRAGFTGTVPGLADTLRRFEDLGADEVTLIPTGTDVRQVAALAEAVEKTVG